jgi:hypothetical protein
VSFRCGPPDRSYAAHMTTDQPTKTTCLKTANAAVYLGLAESTLRYWRHRGVGPKSYRIGRLTFWDVADLDCFIASERQKTERGD